MLNTQLDSLGQFIGSKQENINGGTLFSDPATGEQRYTQRPAGYYNTSTPDVTYKPAFTDTGKLTPDGMKIMSDGTLIPTTTPGTVSSSGVYNEAAGANDKINRQTDIYNTLQQSLKQENDSLLAGIEADYNAKNQAMIEAQKGEKATEAAAQYKLGQSGTAYGFSQIKANDLKRNSELQALMSEKQSLLAKAKRAYASDNIKLYSTYIDKIDKLDEEYYQRDRQNKLDKAKEIQDLLSNEREDKKMKFDEYKFQTGEARLNRTQDLAETKFNYDVTQDMETKTLDNIKRMAESGIDLKSLSDEEISKLEHDAGLTPGSFEAFFSRIQDEADYGNKMDELKMEQLKAQISRTHQLSRGGGGAEKMSEEEKAFQKDLSIAISNISEDKNNWGSSWNYMYSMYRSALEQAAKEQGTTPNAVLDQLLNKELLNPDTTEEDDKGNWVDSISNWYHGIVNSNQQ